MTEAIDRTHPANSAGITVISLETPTLGDRSYLVHDGEQAFVVDPQRDIDRVIALLERHRLRLTHVFESHIHNDYVTGGWHWLGEPVRRTWSTPGTRCPSSARRSGTVRSSRSVHGCESPRSPHRDTPSPTCRTHSPTRPATRNWPSSPADPCCTAPQVAPTCSVRTTPTTWSVHSTPRPTSSPHCCPTQPRCSRPMASDRSAPRPSPRHRRRRSDRRGRPIRYSSKTRRPTSASSSPASAPTPPTTHTWHRPTPPARPSQTSRRRPRQTPPSCGDGSMPGNGSWTCAPAPCSQPGTCPAR